MITLRSCDCHMTTYPSVLRSLPRGGDTSQSQTAADALSSHYQTLEYTAEGGRGRKREEEGGRGRKRQEEGGRGRKREEEAGRGRKREEEAGRGRKEEKGSSSLPQSQLKCVHTCQNHWICLLFRV